MCNAVAFAQLGNHCD